MASAFFAVPAVYLSTFILSLQILWKTVIAEEIIMNYHTSEKALVVKRVKAFTI